MTRRALGVSLTATAAVLLAALAAVPASADSGPAEISVGLGRGPSIGPGFLPDVPYGTPLELFGYSGSGQPLVYTGAGGCTVTPGSGASGKPQAIVAATTPLADCTLTVTTAAGNGYSANSVTYVLPTREGYQESPVTYKGRTVKRNSTTVLGPKDIVTDQDQQVSLEVTKGASLCSLATVKGRTVLRTGGRTGTCQVVATADGIDGTYLPFEATITFRVR